MTDILTIWLPLDFDQAWHWRRGDDYGFAVTLADKEALEGDAAIILPGQMVRLFDHALPKMREQERRAAAGFAVEDKIATPLIDNHIVAPHEDGRIGVISHDVMTRLMSVLKDVGLSAKIIAADFETVRWDAPRLGLSDRILYPGRTGYALDPAWQEDPQVEADIVDVLHSVNLYGVLNFASGAYAAKTKRLIGGSQLVRFAAVFALAGLAWLSWEAVQSRAKMKQAEFIRGQMTQLYADYTGQAAPANPALAVTRAVKNKGGSSADVLSLSAVLFRAVETVPDVSVESLQFNAGQNQLTLRLIYPQFESATDFEAAVRAAGGTLRAGGVREQGGRLLGDAVLTLGGAGS